MAIARTDFEGDPNVGAFGVVTDEFILVSPNMSEKSLELIDRTFNLPILQSTVATLDAVGLMVAATSNGIILPYTVNDDELERLRQSTDVNIDWIDSKLTALGNTVLANDKGAICHPDFDTSAIKKISDTLGVDVVKGTIARLPTVGASAAVTNQGAVVHPLATDDELRIITETLRVEVEVGTVNRGSPYTKLGILANTVGLIAGADTTGVELAHISQVLGFV